MTQAGGKKIKDSAMLKKRRFNQPSFTPSPLSVTNFAAVLETTAKGVDTRALGMSRTVTPYQPEDNDEVKQVGALTLTS